MDFKEFKEYVNKGIEILKLNTKVIDKVSKDTNATLYAVIIIALAGVASAIGTLNLPGIVGVPILALISSFMCVGIIHLFAKLFGGKASFMEYYRAMGVGYVGTWISVIPILGPFLAGLVTLWYIVVNVVILKTIHKFSTGKAILVLLLPAIIVGILIGVLAATFFAGIFALLSSTGSLDSLTGAVLNLR